jgi:hypothetical protein
VCGVCAIPNLGDVVLCQRKAMVTALTNELKLLMSFILIPKHGEDVQVNGWNWRPTLQLIRSNSLIDDETLQRMSAHGCGGSVDGETAIRIAEVTLSKLGQMCPGERMQYDLTITATPKSGQIGADDVYAATFEWLETFALFCQRSGGFSVA